MFVTAAVAGSTAQMRRQNHRENNPLAIWERGGGANDRSADVATLLGRDGGSCSPASGKLPGPRPTSLAAAWEGPGFVDLALERRPLGAGLRPRTWAVGPRTGLPSLRPVEAELCRLGSLHPHWCLVSLLLSVLVRKLLQQCPSRLGIAFKSEYLCVLLTGP